MNLRKIYFLLLMLEIVLKIKMQLYTCNFPHIIRVKVYTLRIKIIKSNNRCNSVGRPRDIDN